jgi:hypothetical protein
MFFLICCYLLLSVYSQEDLCSEKKQENCIDECYFLPFSEDLDGGLCMMDFCESFLEEMNGGESIQIPFVNLDERICKLFEFCEVSFLFDIYFCSILMVSVNYHHVIHIHFKIYVLQKNAIEVLVHLPLLILLIIMSVVILLVVIHQIAPLVIIIFFSFFFKCSYFL